MKQATPAAKKLALSRRDQVLLATLAILIIAWIVTLPIRARMTRETARIQQQIAQQTQTARTANQAKQAEAEASQRVSANPQSAEARLALASVLSQAHRYSDAIQQARIARSLAPNTVEPHLALAAIYDLDGETDLAIQELREVLRMEPDNAHALPVLAYKYVAFGWNRQAEELLLRALKANPNDSHLHVALALCYFQTNNLTPAEQHLLIARRLAPDDPTILGPLIEVYRHAARYNDARAVIEEALKRLPDKGKLYLEQAQVAMETHDLAATVTAADQALQYDPNLLEALYLRAVAEEGQDKAVDAVRDLEKVKSVDPHVEQTLMHLGRLYIMTGRKQEGQQLLQDYDRNRAAAESFSRLTLRVASQPDDADGHMQLARYYYDQNNMPRAIVEAKRVLELRPDDVTARKLLAQALVAAGRSDEAAALTGSNSVTPNPQGTSQTGGKQ